MRKLIHSSFELDLSPFKIADVEENNWFSDSFFTKYTFPFDVDLTDDFDIALGFISIYNAQGIVTYFDCKYVHNDKIEDAIFEIESHQDKLSCVVRFGFEQLPSFDKKLSELPLAKFDLPPGTTIYEHAETIITQTWPAVNYNFPQVHTNKYSVDDTDWEFFEGIINKRFAGAFVENTIVADISYNKNIMQPLPYWIYILQQGMADAGYTLSGNILSDDRLKKATLFGDIDYFKRLVTTPIEIYQVSEDAVDVNYNNPQSVQASEYFAEVILPNPGKYNISGSIYFPRGTTMIVKAMIKYRGVILNTLNVYIGYTDDGWREVKFDGNIETITDGGIDNITVEVYEPSTSDHVIIDITVFAIRVNDASGLPTPTVVNENKIDLTRAVPDITFLDFIKVVKNWFNYDLNVVDKLAIMNRVEFEINYGDAIDLSFTEVKKPFRKFSQGISFLLKFTDIESTEYKYLPVFQNINGVVNDSYVTDDKTTTIEINALPLPLLTRTAIQSAHAFEQNNSKVYLVVYDGIYNGNNLDKPNSDYLIPSVHLFYWVKWFSFRINSHGFNWVFKAWQEKIATLKVKTKIYAYNKVHIIKTINRTEIRPELFEIDIETESLE